jgi:predicted phosphodiesterase
MPYRKSRGLTMASKLGGKQPKEPLRYAQPFFTSVSPKDRAISPHTGTKRISDWTAANVGPIPPPRQPSSFDLTSVIGDQGVKDILAAGGIRIHATGDTGLQTGGGAEEEVALAMTADFHPDAGAQNPAFFLHLGDVIYGHHKDLLYRDEFYRPYKDYPGKIIAIAGNHDGETFAGTDPQPCGAFLDNFCASSASVPDIAKGAGIFRETMIEPGVYWLLDAPFVQIVALYSNIIDGPGYLIGKSNDTSQVDWLNKTLAGIALQRQKGARKALIVAVHHPPYSSAGHAGSPEVLGYLDDACKGAQIMPDAVLSGHSHNYQRYTRRTNLTGEPVEIPYMVAGCGGHAEQAVPPATGKAQGDHTYDGARKGYGYLILTVSPSQLKIESFAVPSTGSIPFDSATVDLKTRRVT